MLATVLVEDVEMIGSWKDPVSLEELQTYAPGLLEQAHLLRHYLRISSRYRALITDQELSIPGTSTESPAKILLSEQEITRRLVVPGSKFIEGFPDPDELCHDLRTRIAVAITEQNIRWIQQGTQEVALFTVGYARPIGYQGVIPTYTLNEDTQCCIREESRGTAPGDNYTIHVVEAPLPPTTTMVIVLQKRDGVMTLGSAYPGILTTAFPDQSWQSPEEYDFCRKAWSELVFIRPPHPHHPV